MHAFPDLFCELYDTLDNDTARENAERWLADENLNSFAAAVRSDVEAGEPVPRIRMRLDSRTDPDSAVYATLLGLDRAFRHVNIAVSVAAERPPRELQELAGFVASHARLDSAAHGGALLPRLVGRGRPEGNVSHKRELFANVLRVPEDSWARCSVTWVGQAAAFDRQDISRGLLVGCVPVIADPGELSFRVREAAGRRFYRIAAADDAATVKRIPEILTALDQAGVLIGVAPEMTLTPLLLRSWQQAIRSPARGASKLRLLLAGSGVLSATDGRASNTAVLLDGRTGAVITRQHKLFAFDFSHEELERWKLDGRLGGDPVAEDLAHGRTLSVIDAGQMRIAILICEDLARLLDIGPLVRDLGISHVLSPVFSRPIRPRRWERTAADVHARETGTTVVVSNSLVMDTILAGDDASAMVRAPVSRDALLASSGAPAEPACFRLLADGTAELL